MRSKFVIVLAFISICVHGQNKRIYNLRECIDSALTNNIQFRSKQLDVAGNNLNLKQSQFSRYPTLNGNVGEGASQGRNFNSTVGSGKTNTNYSTNMGVSSSVTMFNAFKINNTIRQNDEIMKGSQYDAEALKNSITVNVINAYLQVLFAYEGISISQEQVTASASQVDFTQYQMNVGKVAEPVLLQIKSQHANDVLSLVNAKNTVMLDKITLFQLMQIPVDDSAEFEKMNIDSILLIYNTGNAGARSDIYSSALNILPEIKSSQLGISSAVYGLKAAQADRYPKLSLTAGLSSNYYSLYKLPTGTFQPSVAPIGFLGSNPAEKVFSYTPVTGNYPFDQQLSDNIYKSITLTLAIPIFNGYTVENKIRHQQLSIKYAKLNDLSTKNTVRVEVEQSYAQYQTARDTYKAAAEQFLYEQKTYQSVTTRYKLGIVTPTDLQVEKSNYVKSETNLLEAKYNMLYAIKLLEYYQTGVIKL